MEAPDYIAGEVEDDGEDMEEMDEEEAAQPTTVNPRGQLPAPAWVLECKHWLPAASPTAARAAVPSGREEVCSPVTLE